MTDRYYDQGASGANDGTSWTDAYQAFFTAVAACSGATADRLFIKYGSSETDTTNRDWIGGMGSTTRDTPVRVYVAGNGDTAEPPTTYGGKSSATYVNTYSAYEYWNTDIICHGLDLAFNRGVKISYDSFAEFQDCELKIVTLENHYSFFVDIDSWARLINVDLAAGTSQAGAGTGIMLDNNCRLEWIGGSIGATNVPKYALSILSADTVQATIVGVDFSTMNTSSYYLCKASAAADELYCDILFRNCLLGANVVVTDTIPRQGINISLDSCDVTAGDLSRTEDHSYFGLKILDTGVYRTGGASDGAAFSFAVTPNAKCTVGKYWRMPLGLVKQDVSDSTLTVHFCRASGKTGLTDQEIWIEAVTPDNASPLGNYASDRGGVPWATGTTQTTSTESWTGISTPVKQKSSITIAASASQDGEVEVFLCVAYDGSGANDEVYVCPKVEVA